jgi:hypothetical protein
MTMPFDLMTARTDRPAVADRGASARERGPRGDAFPDALRSAVDAGPRGRDRAEPARGHRDDRFAPTDRAGRRDEPRANHRGRPTDASGTAVLTALRSNGLSADALQSVATLLGEPTTATNDELVRAVLDNVEAAVPSDDDAAPPAELDAVVTVTDPTAITDVEVTAGSAPVTALAGDVPATATSLVGDELVDEDATADTGSTRRPGQGHAPSTPGARGLARAAEVAADGARVHDLDAVGDDTTPGLRLIAPAMRAAERAMGGPHAGVTESTDTVRLPVSAVSGEPTPIQGLALGRIPTDRGATPGAASVQRVLDALELLEQAPPPRQITLELGDARVRVALDDGQVRLSVVGPANEAVEKWLEETRAALAQHGFDLGQQAGGRTEDQTDGEQPSATAGPAADGTSVTSSVRDDGGALRL